MTIQQMLLGGAGELGYNLTHSLRSRASASAYLSRTPASSSSQSRYTLSFWVKRGTLGTNQTLLSCMAFGNTSYQTYFRFNSSDQLEFYNAWGSDLQNYVTTQVFRDPSAWYHIVFAVNMNAALSTNTVLMYVNGVQITSFSTFTYTNVFQATAINFNDAHNIGRNVATSSMYFDGYLAEWNFINAQQLLPASFGSTNALTGVWQPAAYTGTYGTNGFYLPFTDNSTAAALGTDFSGNSNTWTVNNISVTAGVTYDSMTDVPTLTSATAANYCVWNTLDVASTMTASNANLKLYGTAAVSLGRASIALPSTGKFYYEMTMDLGADASNAVGYGVCLGSRSKSAGTNQTGDFMLYISNNGYLVQNGVSSGNIGFVPAINSIIQVAVDVDAGKLWFGVNNLYYIAGGASTGNPSTGANPSVTGTFSGLFPFLYLDNTVITGTQANFGQRPFAFTPPTGFVALNAFNLPASTIVKGNTVMDATTYTGNGSTQTITNAAGFQPDLVWAKARSSASWWHILVDSVRGAGRTLSSNATNAETGTGGDCIPALNANGFNVNVTPNASVNENATTYIAWQWQAGQGVTSSNTNGSITSTVSVNASAGFSVVTYTGNVTAGATVGHGLGVAPAFVIAKARGSATSWPVYHQSLGASQYILLNTTAAAVSSTQEWGGVAPTSSVITIGNASANNNQATTNVLYAFAQIAGYSAFGKYQGNSSADGVFVYTGFRPKFVVLRPYDGAADWILEDTSRSSFNVASATLYPNSSGAEASGTNLIDFLSNGFKLRTASGNVNSSSNNYLYAAFAENPFKHSLAR